MGAGGGWVGDGKAVGAGEEERGHEQIRAKLSFCEHIYFG